MSKNWSKYQEAIFHFVQHEEGNAVVEAVAGSGKTTTIVETLRRIPEGASSVFLAFNKSIATELQARGVNAKTFHSLTYSAVTRFLGVRQIDPDKLRKLVDLNMKGRESYLYGTFCMRMVGLARQAGVGCLVPDVEQTWIDIQAKFDIENDNDEADPTRALELCSDLLHWSNTCKTMCDFDDLLYLAVKEGLTLNKFDYVFVDEAQDTNAIQRALLRKVLKPSSRVVAVGDPAQAIYGFRGADSESLNMIAEEFNCVKLPLTVSYRCPTAVVEYAQQWVDHIEAAPDAPEGAVRKLGTKYKLEDFKADDLVVCRTTKSLVGLAYRFIKARIPAMIMGREIGNGLKSLVKKMNTNDIDDMLTKLERWTERECEKALAKQQESKVEAIQDKSDTIRVLADGLEEDDRTIARLLWTIDSLFAEGVGKIRLATIHKAKGLEARRVWWLNRSQCPAKWARQDWQQQQEINLCYVATTRAMEELLLIEER